MNEIRQSFEDDPALIVLVAVGALAVIFFVLVFGTPVFLRYRNRRVNALRRKAEGRQHRR